MNREYVARKMDAEYFIIKLDSKRENDFYNFCIYYFTLYITGKKKKKIAYIHEIYNINQVPFSLKDLLNVKMP